MRCQHCRGVENLMEYKENRYICRKCNTEKSKKYRKTIKGKESTRKAVYKSIEKYKYKQDARVKVNNAVKNGNLLKPSKCDKCQEAKIVEGHHMDYSKPLEVIWLCRTCHTSLHNA